MFSIDYFIINHRISQENVDIFMKSLKWQSSGFSRC